MAGIDLQVNIGGGYNDVDNIHVENGDFALRGGKFHLVPEDDLAMQVGQRLHVRLLLRRGEVFFNTNAGFPYTDVSKFKRSTGIFDTYMKSYIIATDGVTKMQRYAPVLDHATRMETVNFDVTVTDGQTINISQEVDI